MPEGLVVTADPACRPSRTRRRRLIRSLLGAALVVAGVLVPLEPGVLPDPLDDLAADAPALAQTAPVIAGDGEPCPTGWEEEGPDDSVCALRRVACPESSPENPLPGGVSGLQPSSTDAALASKLSDFVGSPLTAYPELSDINGDPVAPYPGFCEARFLESTDEDSYNACLVIRGFVIVGHTLAELDEFGEVVTDDEDVIQETGLCRLLYPASCSVGVRVDEFKCEAFRRRTWSCDGEYLPRNEFNTCYEPLDEPTGPHPACVGIPELVVVTCADYVGGDYVRSPGDADWACGGERFPTGSPDSQLEPHGASQHWCKFDASLLKVECHGASPPAAECADTAASCVKRASQTGGCSAIAHTIRCRSLQASYKAGAVGISTAKVREEGCQPCVVLPFSAAPGDCPGDTKDTPMPLGSTREEQRKQRDYEVFYNAAHRVKQDLRYGRIYLSGGRTLECIDVVRDPDADLSSCELDPQRDGRCVNFPQGHVTWSSTHFSQQAVVNSPVVLIANGLPTGTVRRDTYSMTYGRAGRTQGSALLQYAGSEPNDRDSIIRQWPKPGSNETLRGVADLVSRYGAECLARFRPQLRVNVEQLWPDTNEHREDIKRLFGGDALDWWNALPSDEAKKAHTEARGLVYLGASTTATPAEQEAERKRRTDDVDQVLCNLSDPVWCRWLPSRPGYYKLTPSVAWVTGQYTSKSPAVSLPSWIDMLEGEARQRFIEQWLVINSRVLRALRNSAEERSNLLKILAEDGLGPADVGLTDNLMNFLSLPDNELLYSALGSVAHCPPLDFRFECGSLRWRIAYSELDPIGIAVHEVRVATRTPNS